VGQPIRIANPDPKLLKALADAGVLPVEEPATPAAPIVRARKRQRRYRPRKPPKSVPQTKQSSLGDWLGASLTIAFVVWFVLRAFYVWFIR
jgi:hypothetical protein